MFTVAQKKQNARNTDRPTTDNNVSRKSSGAIKFLSAIGIDDILFGIFENVFHFGEIKICASCTPEYV